jgi:hypothetical protein
MNTPIDDPIDEHPYARPIAIIEMPRPVTDEAALQLYEMMQHLLTGLHRGYGKQIQRAQVERQRAIREFYEQQEALKRERLIRAAQLGLPCADGEDDVEF